MAHPYLDTNYDAADRSYRSAARFAEARERNDAMWDDDDAFRWGNKVRNVDLITVVLSRRAFRDRYISQARIALGRGQRNTAAWLVKLAREHHADVVRYGRFLAADARRDIARTYHA